MKLSRNASVVTALAGGALFLAVAPAGAHHSFAMFDSDKTIVMQGTVAKFDITTPHSWLYLLDAAGARWSLESEGPGALKRAGVTRGSVKVGDKIEVTLHPMRDRPNVGSLVSIKGADGTVHLIINLPTRPDAASAAQK
jgi:hypothetical protein